MIQRMHNKEDLENVVPSKSILKQIWEHSTHQGKIIPSSKKTLGYVLGGQPGSGKSVLTETIKKNNQNIISINGDEYRSWHPYFSEIQNTYGKESSKITAKFAGKVTEALIKKAIKEKYNVVIEGDIQNIRDSTKNVKRVERQWIYNLRLYKNLSCRS